MKDISHRLKISIWSYKRLSKTAIRLRKKIQITANKWIIGNHNSYKHRLTTLKILPSSSNLELHDLFLLSVKTVPIAQDSTNHSTYRCSRVDFDLQATSASVDELLNCVHFHSKNPHCIRILPSVCLVWTWIHRYSHRWQHLRVMSSNRWLQLWWSFSEEEVSSLYV